MFLFVIQLYLLAPSFRTRQGYQRGGSRLRVGVLLKKQLPRIWQVPSVTLRCHLPLFVEARQRWQVIAKGQSLCVNACFSSSQKIFAMQIFFGNPICALKEDGKGLISTSPPHAHRKKRTRFSCLGVQKSMYRHIDTNKL